MTVFFGNISLWVCLCFAIFQFFNSFKKKNFSVVKLNRIATTGLLLSALISFLLLSYAYIVSDFSILNVFQNSHTSKPLLYKIAALWGNHEGSMLLWMLVLAIFNYLISKLYSANNFLFISKTLETQALIILGFLLFIIFTSNPFVRIVPSQPEGMGFNPLLQDPALAIHPPLLYIGYVGFSSAFSFSIAALNLKKNVNFDWMSCMKPFVMFAWTFLSIGIAFGSLWAYYELGWGGWWFWDPVENASFMPWLIGTALIHSLITAKKKQTLRAWVLLLAILAFLLSMIGTFLVRSGILTSVHTFALDPARGIYILIFIAFLGGYSLLLYSVKSKNFLDKQHFSFFSREGTILVNNVIMVIVCASVFLGTIYPLIVEIISKNKISVGEPYFNSVIIPILIPAILIMGIGPLITWGKANIIKTIQKIIPNLILTIVVSFIFLIIYKSNDLMAIIGIILSFWIIFNVMLIFLSRYKNYREGFYKKNDKNQFPISMLFAHFGIGLLILGITGSSVWQNEKITKMKIKDEISINNHKIIFNKLSKVEGPNYYAIKGDFLVYDKKENKVTELNPENRYYPVKNSTTTEASIHTNLLRDLYIVLGDGDVKNGWVVRLYYNPLVIWIWIGAFFIFLGGLTSIKNNLKIFKKLS